eukprot:2454411-Prymnesium_polylepis.2
MCDILETQKRRHLFWPVLLDLHYLARCPPRGSKLDLESVRGVLASFGKVGGVGIRHLLDRTREYHPGNDCLAVGVLGPIGEWVSRSECGSERDVVGSVVVVADAVERPVVGFASCREGSLQLHQLLCGRQHSNL